ncbi:MAG TPA: nitroreductase family protein [Ktedonobacterales bacterium]|jgi:nitroreductase|nr:nitroreductase family protein [Ktedonobacterales bacterium]
MDFSEVMRKRRMVRRFTSEPVEPDVIARIMDLARRAPSAGYTQGQSFVVVTDPATRREIARICGEDEYVTDGFDPFISQPPVIVVPCVSENAYHLRYQQPDKLDEQGNETEWPVPYWFMDVGCSVMGLLLAVVNEGLAAGFAGAPTTNRMGELRRLLGIPEDVTPVGVVPIGHGAPDKPSPSLKRRRKPDGDVIHHERW